MLPLHLMLMLTSISCLLSLLSRGVQASYTGQGPREEAPVRSGGYLAPVCLEFVVPLLGKTTTGENHSRA